MKEEAFELLKQGADLKALVENLSISLSMAKKYSSLFKFLERVKGKITADAYNKLINLDLKAMVLIKMADDTEGLQEILENVDIDIRREDLSNMLRALSHKRQVVQDALEELDYKKEELLAKERYAQDKINDINTIISDIEENISFIKKSSTKECKKFLLDYIGVYNRKLVLKKRVYQGVHTYLKKKNIIQFNSETYVWEIMNIDLFINYIEKRIKENRKLNFDWDLHEKNIFSMPIYSEDYTVPVGLSNAQEYIEKIKAMEEELRKIEAAKKEIGKQIKKFKNTKAVDYMSSVTIANQISLRDIERHARIQSNGLRYLYSQGFICATEIAIDNYRFDVVGYNLENNELIILEAKAAAEDLKRDRKLIKYKEYCNLLYVISDSKEVIDQAKNILNESDYSGIGLLEINLKGVSNIISADSSDVNISLIKRIKSEINKSNCRKVIYGF
jgi:hypothetical protein